jgi:DNA modification methylase
MHFRIVELHRVLKETGSLFFHIGPNEAPYIKLLLDMTFGMNNHRSTITWQRSHPHNNVKNALGSVSDFIYYYTKSDKYTFNLVYKEHDSKYLANSFNNSDSRGRYALAPIIQEKSRKGHVYEFNGVTPPFGWRVKLETLTELHSKNLIHWGASRPYKKVYLEEAKGTPLQNIWTDIHNITRTDVDKRHYPTQKPVKLLERIIAVASTEGCLVLDPFCGSGTTLVAAKNLGRNFIGIDANPEAIQITEERLNSIILDSSLF